MASQLLYPFSRTISVWFLASYFACLIFYFIVDELYAQCDPLKCVFLCLEKENLCFHGHPNETWTVALLSEEVPPELPESTLVINIAKDGMKRKDWLSLVAVHTNSWLIYRLFSLIDELPTLFEIVTERKPLKDKPSLDSGSKSKNGTKVTRISYSLSWMMKRIVNFLSCLSSYFFLMPFAERC
ncbi:hypothetical protein UlMin_018661 [Ulmus minor]